MSTLCSICAEQPPKYKCSSCEIKYCSLTCFKKHKPVHEKPDTSIAPAVLHPNVTSAPALQSDSTASASSIPRLPSVTSPFHALLTNPALQRLIQTHPTLRSQLEHIYNSTIEPPQEEVVRSLPGRGSRGGYRGPFRGRGRGRGGRGDGRLKMPWKQELADKSAVNQILRLLECEGNSEEGLKEFVSLIQRLCGENGTVAEKGGLEIATDC